MKCIVKSFGFLILFVNGIFFFGFRVLSFNYFLVIVKCVCVYENVGEYGVVFL